jgi:TIR domain
MNKQIDIFISYAHEDEAWREELEKHLSILKWQGIIGVWHDRDISAGSEWEKAINAHLETAHLILLLVSPDFIASEYCYGIEMKQALERHEAGSARVLPIIIRPVHWQGAPFGKLQMLPTDAKSVSLWANRDEAWWNVVTCTSQRM